MDLGKWFGLKKDNKLPHEQITLKTAQKVYLGQPAEYPTQLVDLLVGHFGTDSSVEKAYLGWMHMEESGVPPHCVIGLKLTGNSSKTYREVLAAMEQAVPKQALPKGFFFDLLDIDAGGVIPEYLLKQKPFFSR